MEITKLLVIPCFSCPMATFLVLQDWSLRNLLLRVKPAHLGGQARDLQTKQRWVASSEETCSELHVGNSVMMYEPPKPGFPTKLQNLWQGPYVVVKCLQGNTYRLKHQRNFRKRVLRHRDQLRVVSTRPERLRPKTPATPAREEPHTTSQTLQQDGHPSSLTTATSEKLAGSCTRTARTSQRRNESGIAREGSWLSQNVTNTKTTREIWKGTVCYLELQYLDN